MAGVFFKMRKPPGEKKYRGDLRNLRRLKSELAETDPASGAVQAQAEMRSEAENERRQSDGKPDPPGALPEMIIDQRGERTGNKADPDPKSLEPFRRRPKCGAKQRTSVAKA